MRNTEPKDLKQYDPYREEPDEPKYKSRYDSRYKEPDPDEMEERMKYEKVDYYYDLYNEGK